MLENEEDEDEAKRMYSSYTTVTIISCDLLHLTGLEPVVLLVLRSIETLDSSFHIKFVPDEVGQMQFQPICSKENIYKYWVQNGCGFLGREDFHQGWRAMVNI